jgi:prophage DNA circulation protein
MITNTEQTAEKIDDYTEYFSSYHDEVYEVYEVYEEFLSMVEVIIPVSDTANSWTFITQGMFELIF